MYSRLLWRLEKGVWRIVVCIVRFALVWELWLDFVDLLGKWRGDGVSCGKLLGFNLVGIFSLIFILGVKFCK